MDNKKIFRIAFDFAERWNPCPNNLEEWETAAREIGIVSKQGENNPFLIDLLVAVYSQLEREYKRKEEAKCAQ